MDNFNEDEFEHDMKDFETRIKVLRAEYNQYLGGSLKYIPEFTEAQIRKIIKKYATTEGLRGMQRFQYYNLVAKFNTIKEFYGRRIRDIQKGITQHYGCISKDKEQELEKLRAAHRAKEPQKVKGHVVADVSRQDSTMKSMFEVWNECSNSATKPAPPLDFHKFKQMIKSKTDELKKAKECKAVRYRITIEKGQVRIKAKPIK
jgi:hypothetical protein